jgi:transcriptional regulator with XRE-family HTH domain
MSREFIAQKLKELRQKSKLTADEVGEKIGKSGKTVNAWENNRGQPDAEILIALCDIYEVDNILSEFREEKKEQIDQSFNLSDHEKNVIIAYRQQPSMQEAVDRILGLSESEENKKLA